MKELILKINSYLDYINNACGLTVSIHFDGKILPCLPKELLPLLSKYNRHTNPYCMAIKKKFYNKCICNQKDIIKSSIGEPSCRICHGGVYEKIYPVLKGTDTAGFISVSGYRKEQLPPYDDLFCLWEESLSAGEIPHALCDAIIPPLQIMLERLLEQSANETVNEYNMMAQFLNEYHTNITLSDLSEHFNRSKSYISHMFKRESGMSLRDYCNNLKLKDAEQLLLNTVIPVTEIAFDTGFNDVSYFIYLFRKKYGISPLKYRKCQGIEKNSSE